MERLELDVAAFSGKAGIRRGGVQWKGWNYTWGRFIPACAAGGAAQITRLTLQAPRCPGQVDTGIISTTRSAENLT